MRYFNLDSVKSTARKIKIDQEWNFCMHTNCHLSCIKFVKLNLKYLQRSIIFRLSINTFLRWKSGSNLETILQLDQLQTITTYYDPLCTKQFLLTKLSHIFEDIQDDCDWNDSPCIIHSQQNRANKISDSPLLFIEMRKYMADHTRARIIAPPSSPR